MIWTQRKTMKCCRNLCFVILIVSIVIGNGEGNENLKAMESNFLKMNQLIEARLGSNIFKMNQAIEARMEVMESNILMIYQAVEDQMEAMESKFLKMNQVIEQIWLKLDSGNSQIDKGLSPRKVTQIPKMNNTDLQTRVLALEFQMENVQEDVSDVEAEVTYIEVEITNIEGQVTIVNADVSVLSQRQLNQEEKIEDLENVSEGLDTRVTTLEDDDGSDESVTEAINQLNSDVQYLNGTVEVLQSTDIEFDCRLDTLEEVDVNAEIENLDSRLDALELDGTVAFHVGFTEFYPIIPFGGVAVWDYIFFNLGNGYNSVTGEFVVPPGAAGLYYFNMNFLFDAGEVQRLNIRHNGEYLCSAYENNDQSGDYGGSACGAVVQLAEGDAVDVFHQSGTDDTPCVGDIYRSTFSGFRVAPA